jgi:hypothetical protein
VTSEFFGGMFFGVLLAFCVAALIWLLVGAAEKADELDKDQATPLVIDRRLAKYVVKILQHDNRPAVEELVRQLKRAMG